METVILVSPKMGISQIVGLRNSMVSVAFYLTCINNFIREILIPRRRCFPIHLRRDNIIYAFENAFVVIHCHFRQSYGTVLRDMNKIKLSAYCSITVKCSKGLGFKLSQMYRSYLPYNTIDFSFQPVPLADIEQVTLVKVQKDDQISSTVTLYLQNTVQKVNTIDIEKLQYFVITVE